ncbi:FtsX-like permease family protein [Streptomyces sp. NPDC001985]|uniref:FtsX-like permease family protein n=1 Tax=Streptomyces sp. NPDC001985 TaxID=3154406 RepID=UPI003317FA16
MLLFVRRQLAGRLLRSLALLLGLLVAVSSFVVLSSTTESSRLDVLGTLSRDRGAYDILVRPRDSAGPVESARGLIRPNAVSEVYGGITTAQVARIGATPGVRVAAPIAVLGFAPTAGRAVLDFAEFLPKGTKGTYDISRSWTYDRGLSAIPQNSRRVYITPHPITVRAGETVGVGDGHRRITNRYLERLPSGREVEVCEGRHRAVSEGDPHAAEEPVVCLSWASVTTIGHDGRPVASDLPPTTAVFTFPASQVVAGVDPAAEARLLGLDRALTAGTYLTPGAPRTVRREGFADSVELPLLRTRGAESGLTVRTEVRRLGDGATVHRAELDTAGTARDSAPGTVSPLDGLLPAGPVRYTTGSDGALRPRTVPRTAELPLDGRDLWFRALPAGDGPGAANRPPVHGRNTGTFDPRRLPAYDSAARVPLGAYTAPGLSGADAASRKLLGGGPLLPGVSPTGYLQQPPLMLTTLDAAAWLGRAGYLTGRQHRAPVSAVRVAVTGVTGADEVSRERVRAVAESITRRTGLEVDIALGSSPAAQTVALPEGEFGRPELRLQEWWSKKNVVAVISEAVDRKSVVLLVLMLTVCSLFTANATAASVRARREELGLLAAVGWGRGRLFAAVLGESALIGTAAGVLGVGAALAAGELSGVGVSASYALLAVPGAVGVAALGGLVPAWRASRAAPLEALRPAVAAGRRSRAVGGVTSLALAGLVRSRARTLLGVTASAIAAGSVTLLVAAVHTFEGVLAGSLLGDAVSVRIRAADIAAVGMMVLLAAVAVGDVMYLNIRDRMGEFAALRATGWTDRTLARLVLTEGAVLGLTGSVAGASVAAGVTVWLAPGGVTASLVGVGVVTVVGGVLLAVAGTAVPVVALRRQPVALLLARA